MITWEAAIEAIRSSFGFDTTGNVEEWSTKDPSVGQCKVASLVFQDIFGGGLVVCVVGRYTHCYNLVSGVAIDITRDQFSGSYMERNSQVVSRADVLSSGGCDGYDVLRDRVRYILNYDQS